MEDKNSDKAKKLAAQDLLRRAQEQIRSIKDDKSAAKAQQVNDSPAIFQKIVHQLQVHQIELEMQNEELRRTQFELEIARLRYFDLYDLAPVGYCTLSEQGLILEGNLMAAKLFDCSRGDLVNKPMSRFVCKVDQDIYYLHRKRLLSTGAPQTCEVRIINNSGEPIWVNLNSSFEKDSDGVPFLRIVITDISARKQAELTLRVTEERYYSEQNRLDRRLKDSNLELMHAIARAEQASAVAEKANRAKSDFLSNMSHELRTPLGTILGFAQLIDTGEPPPTPMQKRIIEQILRAGWYLLDLINEILDLALIESGALSICLEPVPLFHVLHDCQAMMEPLADKKSVEVIFNDIDAPFVVLADPTRLKQVLINLLSNAIKYNKPGGSVVINCSAALGRLRMSVNDSGPGLTPESIAQLFQPFIRLGQENSGEEGTGIGLVMTKRLIELMGGKIGLESTLGEGSKFWVDMDLAAETPAFASPAAIIPSAPALLPAATGTSIYTLLYIEDNPANLLLVENIIARRADIRLLTACDGTTGISTARSALPDIILMDINLPGISGTNALMLLKKDPLTAHIPVIALSANAIPLDIKKGLEAGFFRYLTKPIKIDALMSAIGEALSDVHIQE